MVIKYIELVGVAGVGKTTVVKQLTEIVNSKTILLRARGPIGKGIWLKLHILLSISIIVLTTPKIFSLYFLKPKKQFTKTKHIREVIRNLVTRMIIDTAVIRCLIKENQGCIVNDEGLIGKLVSLSILTNIDSSKIDALILKLMPMPTSLIFVTAPSAVALKREGARTLKLPFFDNMKSDIKKNFFNEASAKYIELAKILNSKFNINSEFIDNSEDYRALISKVEILALKIERAQDLHFYGENKK